jgi:hypothetical protein
MNFMLLYIFYNFVHKNNNIGQHLRYKKLHMRKWKIELKFFISID